MSRTGNWQPTASLQRLAQRAALLKRLRRFFDERGFLEVETPLLGRSTVVDRYIEPIAVPPFAMPGEDALERTSAGWFLQTSPEATMKRLLAAGASAIYQVTRSFRAGERGRLHNPEFTIVEWYRVGDDYDRGMALLDELADAMLERGRATRIAYRHAFAEHAGLDPAEATLAELQSAASAPDDSDRDGLLNRLWAARVEPHLGHGQPAIVFDWPASLAALARVRQEDWPVAERFELYVDGVELANGYHELVDADELERRTRHANEARRSDGKPTLGEPTALLDAMRAGLPPATGVALGFDRLAMVALGAATIDEVVAFPANRA
jgi:lysyl-tRNA synthetase class 2